MARTAAGGAGALARALALLFLALGPATAQSVDCGRLRAELAALPSGSGEGAARYSAAASRQSAEITRTAAYAASIGCERRQFLIFGSPPPPQCGEIGARIARMRANLGQLQGAAQSDPYAGRRGDLSARYDTYCRGQQSASRGLFEDGGLRRVPIEDAAEPVRREATPRPPRGGGRAVCVRTCDGGYFPVNTAAARGDLEQLGALCQALCPNVEAAVYTFSGEIESAVSAQGEPYKDLPAAFRYRTSFDPACTCKPPGRTWTEALAEAEKLLGQERRNDIVVTEETSLDLLRGAPIRPPGKAKDKGAAPQAEDAELNGETVAVAAPEAPKRRARTGAPQL